MPQQPRDDDRIVPGDALVPSEGGGALGGAVAAVDALGSAVERVVLGTVRDVHQAVADRAFRLTPGSAPVRLLHDTVSRGVYGAVASGLRLTSLAGAAAVAARGDTDDWLDGTPRRSALWSALHGIAGAELTGNHPQLDLPVQLRVEGRPIRTSHDELAAAFPDASGRVAVFLHGLTESDRSWDLPKRRLPPGAEALPDVVAGLGWTPVRLRYGTGRAVVANGVELADLLEELLDGWPAPVEELALVGHSMGGLVARAALLRGQELEHRWVERVEHTVALGTPHLGSWLERAATRGVRQASRAPELAPFAAIIDRRARGIKDLHDGVLFDIDVGPDAELPPDPPLLDGAVHHLIAGRLTRSPDHPVTRLFGDLLVSRGSALGDERGRQLVGAQVETLEVATDHFGLLRHPEVAAHLRRWFA